MAGASASEDAEGEGEAPAFARTWTFTEGALAQTRAAVQERASQLLSSRGAAEEAAGGPVGQVSWFPVRVLSLEDGCRLVTFYAKRLPGICRLCSAPSEVLWTSAIFYRRFFVARSPMEYDPVTMMFACIHVACKAEEVHEISLDRLLEVGGLGAKKEEMGPRVCALELPLLEGLHFALLVEPQLENSLQMLAQDLPLHVSCRNAPNPTPVDWDAVLQLAEDLALDVAARTDVILLYPLSAVILGCAAAALEARAPELDWSARPCGAAASYLEALLGKEAPPIITMVLEVHRLCREQHGNPPGTLSRGREKGGQGHAALDVTEAYQTARRCHKVFECLWKMTAERRKVRRLERKRCFSQMHEGS